MKSENPISLKVIHHRQNPIVTTYSIYFSTIIFTITRGWHNKPGVAAVPIASQTTKKGGRSSSPGGVKNFLFFKSCRPALGSTQPPIQLVTAALSPEIKRPGREADHSLSTSAEVKKMWIYKSTPPYAFMAQCLNS
jgi:hypothetical protein